MFVSSGQFFIFVRCLVFGFFCGLIYLVPSGVKRTSVGIAFNIFVDVFYLFLCSLIFVLYSYLSYFSNLRAYMFLGFFAGFIIECKTFNILLANAFKKMYNILKKKRRKAKNDRIKV